MIKLIIRFVVAGFIGCAVLTTAADAQNGTALRRKCAHLVKVKLGIKETGSVNDLAGIPGAVAMVDRCVARKGKVD